MKLLFIINSSNIFNLLCFLCKKIISSADSASEQNVELIEKLVSNLQFQDQIVEDIRHNKETLETLKLVLTSNLTQHEAVLKNLINIFECVEEEQVSPTENGEESPPAKVLDEFKKLYALFKEERRHQQTLPKSESQISDYDKYIKAKYKKKFEKIGKNIEELIELDQDFVEGNSNKNSNEQILKQTVKFVSLMKRIEDSDAETQKLISKATTDLSKLAVDFEKVQKIIDEQVELVKKMEGISVDLTPGKNQASEPQEEETSEPQEEETSEPQEEETPKPKEEETPKPKEEETLEPKEETPKPKGEDQDSEPTGIEADEKPWYKQNWFVFLVIALVIAIISLVLWVILNYKQEEE